MGHPKPRFGRSVGFFWRIISVSNFHNGAGGWRPLLKNTHFSGWGFPPPSPPLRVSKAYTIHKAIWSNAQPNNPLHIRTTTSNLLKYWYPFTAEKSCGMTLPSFLGQDGLCGVCVVARDIVTPKHTHKHSLSTFFIFRTRRPFFGACGHSVISPYIIF